MRALLIVALALTACGSAAAAYPKATPTPTPTPQARTTLVPPVESTPDPQAGCGDVSCINLQTSIASQVSTRVLASYNAWLMRLSNGRMQAISLSCIENGATLHFRCDGRFITTEATVALAFQVIAVCSRDMACQWTDPRGSTGWHPS